MPELRFLADMNISPQTVLALREKGWDIIRGHCRACAPAAHRLTWQHNLPRYLVQRHGEVLAIFTAVGKTSPGR